MKKQIIKRCPWCGHDIEKSGVINQMIKKCSHCDHQYTESVCEFGNQRPLAIIWISLMLLSIVFLVLSGIYSLKFIILAHATLSVIPLIGGNQKNYIRDDEYDTSKFMYKKYTADIFFNEELSKKQKKSYLIDASIIPVCFVDLNDFPVSNTICIFIENAAIKSDNNFECTFSFLPLSEVKFNIKGTGIHFFLFDGKYRIGEGVVTGIKDAF